MGYAEALTQTPAMPDGARKEALQYRIFECRGDGYLITFARPIRRRGASLVSISWTETSITGGTDRPTSEHRETMELPRNINHILLENTGSYTIGIHVSVHPGNRHVREVSMEAHLANALGSAVLDEVRFDGSGNILSEEAQVVPLIP